MTNRHTSHLDQNTDNTHESTNGAHDDRWEHALGQGWKRATAIEGDVGSTAGRRGIVELRSGTTTGQVGTVRLRHTINVSDKLDLRVEGRTPMGLESSAKAQLLSVQRHSPLIGSQNAVEQLDGTTYCDYQRPFCENADRMTYA